MFRIMSNEWKNGKNFQSLIFRSVSFHDCYDFIVKRFPNARYNEESNCWVEISYENNPFRSSMNRIYRIIKIRKEND